MTRKFRVTATEMCKDQDDYTSVSDHQSWSDAVNEYNDLRECRHLTVTLSEPVLGKHGLVDHVYLRRDGYAV